MLNTKQSASAAAWPRLDPGYLLWLVLGLVCLAELLTATVYPLSGMVVHTLLLAALLIYSGLDERAEVRNLALALVLAPLIRLLSLALPLYRLPQMAWYPAVSTLLMVSVWFVVRQTGTRGSGMGLRLGDLRLQLPLALVGPGLGVLEYQLLRPAAQPQAHSWLNLLIMAFTLLIFTGLVEELIFRGLLQNLAPLVLGRWGLLYVSVLFGVLHIGYLSLADVVFVTLVGLLFAQLVRWSGSILGVTLAHGTTNMTLFLLMPWLADQPAATLSLGVITLTTMSGLSLAVIGGIMRLQAAPALPIAPANAGMRELRRGLGLNYHDLARRAGLAARRLAEIELGLRAPQPDELRALAAALGVSPERLAPAAGT
jgi:uncharacterized protein